MVEATIDPYNSKESTGHPESDDKAYDEKAKKEKRTNDSLIKHLLDVNQQKRSEALEDQLCCRRIASSGHSLWLLEVSGEPRKVHVLGPLS